MSQNLKTDDIQQDTVNSGVGGAENEILTFKNIFYFFKRTLLRTLIYCLATVLISVAFFMTFNLVKSTSKIGKAYAQINFNYSGIEKGLDPSGKSFDVGFIKSPNIISKAINNLGLDYDVNTVRNNLHINAVVPAEIAQQLYYTNQIIEKNYESWEMLKDISFYPSDFIIELVDFANDENVVKDLLEEIIKQAKVVFISNFTTTLNFNFSFLDAETMQEYDFIDQHEIFEAQLLQFEEYFDRTLKANYANFKSYNTGLSFAELNIKANLLLNYDLVQISKFITADNITKYTYGNYTKLLKVQEKNFQSQINVLAVKETAVLKAIEDYAKDSTIIIPSEGAPIEINRPTAYYESLISDSIKVKEEKKFIEEKLTKITELHDIVSQLAPNDTSSQANIDNLNSMFEALLEKYNGLIDEIRITFADFISEEYSADVLKTVIPSVYSSNVVTSTNFNLVYLIAIAVILGIFISFTETGIRIYIESKKKLTTI